MSTFLGSKVNANFDVKLYVKISSPFGHQWRFSTLPYKVYSEVKYFKYENLRKIRARASEPLQITTGTNRLVWFSSHGDRTGFIRNLRSPIHKPPISSVACRRRSGHAAGFLATSLTSVILLNILA